MSTLHPLNKTIKERLSDDLHRIKKLLQQKVPERQCKQQEKVSAII
jgi:hypothetical protein